MACMRSCSRAAWSWSDSISCGIWPGSFPGDDEGAPCCGPPVPEEVETDETELTCRFVCSVCSVCSVADWTTWTRISGRATRIRGPSPYSNATSMKKVPGSVAVPALTIISRVSEKSVSGRDWVLTAGSPPSGTNRTPWTSAPGTSAPSAFSTVTGIVASSPTGTV